MESREGDHDGTREYPTAGPVLTLGDLTEPQTKAGRTDDG